MPTVNELKNATVVVDDTPEIESKKATGVDDENENDKGKGKADEPIVKQIL